MATVSEFKRGDRVSHPRRPEWGSGVVRDAAPTTHEGRPAQRLAVDFANKGRVTINTAVAPLDLVKEREEEMTRTTTSGMDARNSTGAATAASTADKPGGWLGALERSTGGAKHELWDLPDLMTNPFASLQQRLKATLDSYRFGTDPRSLIEWASVQTGLNDPLSKYSRPELEQAFPRFTRDRDAHLKQLVWQMKKRGEAGVIAEILRNTRHPAAKTALERASRH